MHFSDISKIFFSLLHEQAFLQLPTIYYQLEAVLFWEYNFEIIIIILRIKSIVDNNKLHVECVLKRSNFSKSKPKRTNLPGNTVFLFLQDYNSDDDNDDGGDDGTQY